MSNFDPFEQLALDTQHPRRRDLREKSTGRSRRAARRRAATDRKARAAMKSSVNVRPPGGPKAKKSVGRRIWSGIVSVVALALAAAFAFSIVGSPLLFSGGPATASVTHSASNATVNGQKLTSAPGKEPAVDRSSVQGLTATELYAMQVGGLDYTVNNSGIIRWPFNYPVPINSPFGSRAAPCPGCSTFHRGTDFDTGDKAPVFAVAAGVVTASELAGSYGQYVEISHDINGKQFSSIYAHLTADSETVQVGDVITEGELIGLTGSTGESTGPHLDFEIDIDGTAVDSFVWLKANTAH
ncbi:MAG TPA: M23 family metallopeptidase [Galbitalea sp.]|nr:M23 family metallopeptidase [Galbitalea sp.]